MAASSSRSDRFLGWIETEQTKLPAISQHLARFSELYQKKLWHQLTVALEDSLEQPEVQQTATFLPALYDNFIAGFAYRLNPLRLARLAVTISKHHKEPSEAISFLERVSQQVRDTKQLRIDQPLLFLKLQVAQVELHAGNVAACKQIIEAGREELDAMHDVDPDVSAAYYFNRSLLYKQQKDFAEFYKSSLLYLAFISSDALPQDVRLSLAVDISLAALLGENVYNFGELLLHPLIRVLDDTPYEWLHRLLDCFNNGDMHGYDRLCGEYAEILNSLPAMVDNERKLREKITILSLTELIFKLPADQRTIPLSLIAERTKLNIDGVEFLLMKALSLNLIRGTIDEVEQTVHVTWVQPRVLTKPQIADLSSRLGGWISKVSAGVLTLEAESLAVGA